MIFALQLSQLAPDAAGDGVTDDTRALQGMLDALPSGASVDFGTRTYLVSATLDGTRLSGAKLFGPATIRAKEGTDFQFLLDISGTSAVTIEGLTFDAAKSRRRAAAGALSCLKANATTDCQLSECVFTNSLGPGGQPVRSTVAVSASGGCSGLRVERCAFIDCGISATERPSDGVFVRGNNCVVANCRAENVTDHGFVLEGCNNSTIADCTGTNCTAVAGMSNDTDQDVEGNAILRIRATCNYFGSFGGVVGAYTFGSGRLRRCRIDTIDVAAADGARGGGGALYFFGKLDGLRVSNATVDARTSSKVMHHGIVVDGATGLHLSGCRVRADGNGTCIRLVNDSADVVIEDCRFENGTFGIYADGTSRFAERRNAFVNCHATVGLGGRALRL